MGNEAGRPWWEQCEWNDQDATRTLQHIDDLSTGWTAGIPPESATDPAIRDARQRVAEISRSWHEQPDRLGAHARELFAHLATIDDARRALTRPTPRYGSVERINSSAGGVPKPAVATARIGWRGIAGDGQNTRVHHGRPWQALSLWSVDVIDRLAAAGHPVRPGGAGENLSIRGIDWSTMRAGAIIEIGTVRCQLTAPAVPCAKVASNFTDGDLSLIDHDLSPGSSRWYAAVLAPGTITTGDAVTAV